MGGSAWAWCTANWDPAFSYCAYKPDYQCNGTMCLCQDLPTYLQYFLPLSDTFLTVPALGHLISELFDGKDQYLTANLLFTIRSYLLFKKYFHGIYYWVVARVINSPPLSNLFQVLWYILYGVPRIKFPKGTSHF